MKKVIRRIVSKIKQLINRNRKLEYDYEYDEVYMKELEYGHEYQDEENIKSYSEMTDEELSEIMDELCEKYKDIM